MSSSLLRIFFYFALVKGTLVAQLDLKMAFFNADLKADVWVISLSGVKHVTSRCYELNKPIHGLKQVHLAWHSKICMDLKDIGFKELPSTPFVFRRIKDGQVH